MHVAILHNEVSAGASAAEQDVLTQVEAVEQALARLGHDITAVPVTLDLAALARRLERNRPQVVFNLVESLAGSDRLGFLPAALLDRMGVPYTGSPTEALLVSGDKPAAKARLVAAGLPTPAWMTAEDGADLRGRNGLNGFKSGGKFIIKPAWEHASLGMTGDSVVGVRDLSGLARRLSEHAGRTECPSFAEHFVEGRELNLSLLASDDGPEVLPAAEIDFSAFPRGMPRIVGYQAKWDEESFEYRNTPRTFDLESSDGPMVKELGALAGACWRLFGLRGYARVDFRVDREGRPWILEINANPCLSPDAGFAAAVGRASIGFDRAVTRILEDASRGAGCTFRGDHRASRLGKTGSHSAAGG